MAFSVVGFRGLAAGQPGASVDASHLIRDAYLYVRQSTPRQVSKAYGLIHDTTLQGFMPWIQTNGARS